MTNTPHLDDQEIVRRKRRSDAVLDLLRDRAWHLNDELALPEYGGHSFNAHIKTLRDQGYVIKCEHVEGPVFRYKFIQKDDPIDYRKKMTLRQRAVAHKYVQGIIEVAGIDVLRRIEASIPEHYRIEDEDNGE